ncbi:tri-snRNP-associated protein 1 [Seminavis robusta]|uniref:Tri-snRNP-associated protein 1 n=1 Tax=Seminavis robusta TaxID=568900 RepID=A0A9N8HKB3_9STRA|nr:tri-snRNP-associated protein 1 [Seminavis robusta]|eukprot:Sro822_g207490.1 tri-snRNP-associated protein 1 (801) ;mRNA; f:35340-37742
MANQEVIELSVDETNKLRAELGLAPLRIDGHSTKKESLLAADNNQGEGEEVLELSVDDTNALRAKLGLPPLRSIKENIQDANLKAKQEEEEKQKAAAQERLENDVKKGIASTFTAKSLGETESTDVASWAAKLMRQQQSKEEKKKKKKDKKSKKKNDDKYDADDLKGMTVSHAMGDLEAGSTTVMTLADAPILTTKESNPQIVTGLNEDATQLENVNLAEASKQQDGLRKKRQLEMGMGRAGGYAGFDDDEFVELGGTGAPSKRTRGGGDPATGSSTSSTKKTGKGFQIGDDANANDAKAGTDMFAAMEAGKAISLEPMQADVQASDFLTEQEDLELRGKKEKKAKKKEKFDKKKKKKDKKKDKKKHRRRQTEDDDDDNSEVENKEPSGKSLLEELEETAEDDDKKKKKKSRKRSRRDDDDDKEDDVEMEEAPPSSVHPTTAVKKESKDSDVDKTDKRAKYDAIMDKGNARTQQAFAKKKQKEEDDALDEEPDDAFLNAALAKARRLKKLRDMSGAKKGAQAVVQAVQQMMPDQTPSSDGVTFSVDDTREFTRALRAKSEQQSRKAAAKEKEKPAANTITTTTTAVKKEPTAVVVETVTTKPDGVAATNNDDEFEEDVDMAELAKEVKDDDEYNTGNNFLEGTTGNTVAVGRGLAGVVHLFKQTGDLTRKNAGKEEMRGRAKDERTYEDYEAVDLKSVVKIDERYATDKDKDLANREVKLEYRDKHGRLLTRKAAFRELCYQFHGHGSSKRKVEKRQKQMARENAEARLASQQSDGGPGTFGALKATQKATGKAFVVHKT